MITSADLQSGCCAAASSAVTSKRAAVAAATKARIVVGLCWTEAEMSTAVRRGVTWLGLGLGLGVRVRVRG